MNQLTALIVDDEPHIRYMLDFKFSNDGLIVITASCGEEALGLALLHRPDVIVTDLQMPGRFDGLEFCRRLAADPSTQDIPVLMVTARGHRVPPEEIAATNIQCLLSKPFSPRDLVRRARQLISATAAEGGNPTS